MRQTCYCSSYPSFVSIIFINKTFQHFSLGIRWIVLAGRCLTQTRNINHKNKNYIITNGCVDVPFDWLWHLKLNVIRRIHRITSVYLAETQMSYIYCISMFALQNLLISHKSTRNKLCFSLNELLYNYLEWVGYIITSAFNLFSSCFFPENIRP